MEPVKGTGHDIGSERLSLACEPCKTPREQLLELLLRDGILRRSETQPVLSRDGTSARWMLDSLPVTLTPSGAELAARLVLERLQGFDGHQLATFGLTGCPDSAIGRAASPAGATTGFWFATNAKPHGARKLIEGRIEIHEPVNHDRGLDRVRDQR